MNRCAPPVETIGVIAGRGDYPHVLIERLAEAHKNIVVAGISTQFGRCLQNDAVIAYEEFFLGQFQKAARFFHRFGAAHIAFAGGVDKRGLGRILRPDFLGLKTLLRFLTQGDNELLSGVCRVFEKRGFKVFDPACFLAKELPGAGHFGGPRITGQQREWIHHGLQCAMQHGRKDRGQAVIMYKGRLFAKEDIHGTDALIASAPGPGAFLFKCAKPGQTLVVDRPCIGPSTIHLAAHVGMGAIIVCDQTFVFHPKKVKALCRDWGIAVEIVSSLR